MASDILNVEGDINGTTKLIIHATSATDIRDLGNILFASSVNDMTRTASSFNIYRVYGSPYLYDIIFNDLGENSKEWFFGMINSSNPNFNNNNNNIAVSEVIAYLGLHSAGIEHTRSVIDNVKVKVA